MARPAVHDSEVLLDAARELVLGSGPRSAGIREIARLSGAPSGSLYHRFGSRDGILIAAWLRAVRRFQAGFIPALEQPDPRRATAEAIRWSVRFAAEQPADTELLLRFGREDLLDSAPPADAAAELAVVNERLERALRRLARRLFASAGAAALERTAHAVIDLPYAALRRHMLAGTFDPVRLGPALESSALAIAESKESRP
jgi:AcrR family transcriptional regulator